MPLQQHVQLLTTVAAGLGASMAAAGVTKTAHNQAEAAAAATITQDDAAHRTAASTNSQDDDPAVGAETATAATTSSSSSTTTTATTTSNSSSDNTEQKRPLFQPKLNMRPVRTSINLIVCGASGTGKSSFIRACAKMLSASGSANTPFAAAATPTAAHPAPTGETKPSFTTSEIGTMPAADSSSSSNFEVKTNTCAAAAVEATGIGQAVDPHAVLLSGAKAFATVLPSVLCPEACRELVYTFQVSTIC
jgi:hypothetical protein